MNTITINIRKHKYLLFTLLTLCISTLLTFCNNVGTTKNDAAVNADNRVASAGASPAQTFTVSTEKENYNTNITNAKLVANRIEDATTIQATLAGSARRLPVYGFNGNITQSPSFANKTFRDSVASLGLKIIRYPGGSVSNFWDWRKGWFESGANIDDVENPKAALSNRQTNNYGLNQLKQLVDEAKCDVVFTLNIVTKTVEDQIEMLKTAQGLGIPIKWIELGNEFNLKNNPARKKFVSPEVYGKLCYQWITRLKQQFPNAKVAVVGGNRDYNKEVKNWNVTVLNNATNADAIVSHMYASPDNVADASGINFEKLYRAFSNRYTDAGFNTIGKNVNIWVTEYNILWALARNKSLTSNVGTWGQALGAILMTSTITNLTDQIQLILNHNIANSNAFAAIETRNETFRKLPNGVGMQAWFTALNQMTELQKINLNNGGSKLNDYELFGWKFSNGQSKSNLLICNLTNSASTVSLGKIASANATYNMKYGDKRSPLNDVRTGTGRLTNGSLELPPYSVAIVSNQ